MEYAMINVADYIIKFLQERGVKYAFQVTGGGAMFLNDAVEKSNIKPIFCHHEQSCAMAAVGYTKVTNEPSLVIPTSGCGSTNTITGILDAWQDSHPVIVVSGQANKKDTTYLSSLPLRKLGVQEVNIIEIVKSITKFSTMITEPEDVAIIMEKAFHIATSGRQGPVWIDVPLDVQNSIIDEEKLAHWSNKDVEDNEDGVSEFEAFLKNSKRPVVIAGNGINSADARKEFVEFVEKYNLPCTFTFLATDLLDAEHPLYIGRLGIKGTRAGNFAVANADLIISIGSSLSIPLVGYRYEFFGRDAKKFVVDIDKNEHLKETIKIDKILQMDARKFLVSNMEHDYSTSSSWQNKCLHWKNKWNVFDRNDIRELNMYSFSKKLSSLTKDINSAIIADAGSAYYVMAQSAQNSRIILPGAQGEMGFTLPASVGVALANKDLEVFGVTGDGSFQFNIQELQTIMQYNLPIKTVVLNNNGYLSIKNTQRKYFNERYSGTEANSGVSFPDCSKIAKAYGMKYFKISKPEHLDTVLPEVVKYDSYCICEVICPETENIVPTAASKQNADGKIVSQPLENMFPFLSDEEFEQEMIIKPIG
jgi:acetolactate synthase-1/2/3 large subunit